VQKREVVLLENCPLGRQGKAPRAVQLDRIGHLMIARQLEREIAKREERHKLPE
jgi:hypothetical protein